MQAEDKLRRENVRSKDRASQIHKEVARKVRQTIRELGSTIAGEFTHSGEHKDGGKPRKEAAQSGAETSIAMPAASRVIRQTLCAASPIPLASEKRSRQKLELEFSACCQ